MKRSASAIVNPKFINTYTQVLEKAKTRPAFSVSLPRSVSADSFISTIGIALERQEREHNSYLESGVKIEWAVDMKEGFLGERKLRFVSTKEYVLPGRYRLALNLGGDVLL